MTTSFSTTSYYKDIDTLSDLDKSGLHIGTTSASLKDIFGEDPNPLIESLKSKFYILSTTRPVIERTAYDRDICSLERQSDINIIIAVSRKHNKK